RTSGSCFGCPGCCVSGTCVQMSQACSTNPDTVCVAGSQQGMFACVDCGLIGQPACGGTCKEGCRANGNAGAVCVAKNDACSNGLFCLDFNGSLSCQRCGQGRDDLCCPSPDGGAPTCGTIGCCDPGTNRCVIPDGDCFAPNTSCQKSMGLTCAA